MLEKMMAIDMPFIQNKQEEAFLLCDNNTNIKKIKGTPNKMKELVG